jgi:hypothetical protein
MPWPFVQAILELIQVQASIRSKGSIWRGLHNYYGAIENWQDTLRIALMCVYIWTDFFPAEVFSLLCLLSVFGLMNFMRYDYDFAVFIELYQASLRDMKEFMAFLMMIFMAFTVAFYYRA